MKNVNHLLKLGLIAMSKSLEKGFWLHGHVGAEVLTNTFFIIEFNPDEDLRKAIIKRIETAIHSQKEYFPDSIPDFMEDVDLSTIEKLLEENVSRLSTAGHGVIFGTLVVKAVKYLGGWLPQDVNEGLVALLKNTQKDHKERYYKNYDYQNNKISLSTWPKVIWY